MKFTPNQTFRQRLTSLRSWSRTENCSAFVLISKEEEKAIKKEGNTQQMTLKRMDENTSPDLAPLHSYTKDYTVWQHLYFFNVQKHALRIILLDVKY